VDVEEEGNNNENSAEVNVVKGNDTAEAEEKAVDKEEVDEKEPLVEKKSKSRDTAARSGKDDVTADGKGHTPEPFRTDPLKEFFARQKRLERASAASMPEVHCTGQISYCKGLAVDESDGVFCRWRVEFDKAWHHLGGDLTGQTQVAYNTNLGSEARPLNHPIDLHFAEAGLHVLLHYI
jgi:hypothetical protein